MHLPRIEAPALRSIAALFARAGNLTVGGGDAITATLLREMVHRRGWLSFDQYALAQSLAKIAPGTGILAFSAAAGWMLRRWAGAITAVLAVAVPSGVLVVLLTWGFTSLEGNAVASSVLDAVLASAVGMMWAAAWLLARPQLGRATWLRTTVMAAGGFLALSQWSISPIQILAVAALVGAFWRPGAGGTPGGDA